MVQHIYLERSLEKPNKADWNNYSEMFLQYKIVDTPYLSRETTVKLDFIRTNENREFRNTDVKSRAENDSDHRRVKVKIKTTKKKKQTNKQTNKKNLNSFLN